MGTYIIGLILLALAGYSLTDSLYNTYVCSPANITEPLQCSSEQWVQILREIYSPKSESPASCEPNVTSCSTVFYDTDLVANCNGPKPFEACREETSVALAQHNRPCLQTVTDITINVHYDCIDKSSILDLCGASAVIKSNFSTVTVYLASPNFPRATPTGTLCTCTIQGMNVKMTAVDVNVQSKLPWESDPTMNIKPYKSVFSVSSDGDEVLWTSQCTDTSDCSNHHILNTNLFMPLTEDKNLVNVTYSDFGMYGQNVWVEVVGHGNTLNVICASEPLPPNRIITTTTSSATKTSSTTSTTSITPSSTITLSATTTSSTTTTPPTTTVSSTRPSINPTIPTSTSQASITPSVAVYPPTIPPLHVSTTKKETTPTVEDLRGDKSKQDSIVLIITLVCILLVLVIIAIVVGYLVYRKRRKFNYNGKIGLKALFLSLYHQMTNREQEKTGFNDSPFDPIALEDVKQNPSSPKSKQHYERDNQKTMDIVLAVTDDKSKNKHRSWDTTKAKHSSTSLRQKESETESDLNEKDDIQRQSSASIYNEIYQSGHGIVEVEIERIRQQRNRVDNRIPETYLTNSELKQFEHSEMASPNMEDVDIDCYSLAKSLESAELEKSGNQSTQSKKKKPSKADLVSNILQLSLQDIKQMRTQDIKQMQTLEHQKGDLETGGDKQTKGMSEC